MTEVAAQASTEMDCKARKRNIDATDAYDAVQQPGKMIQMTVFEKHPVDCDELRATFSALRSQLATRLHFVVPPDQYAKFNSKKIGKGPGVSEIRKVEQWILRMPYWLKNKPPVL